MIRAFFVLAYLSTALSLISVAFGLWMFIINTRFRFRRRKGSLAISRYVYGIVWRTTIVRLVVSLSILYQGITLLLPPVPQPARIENIVTRLIASVTTILIVVGFSLMDNPNLSDSNEQLQKDYEEGERSKSSQSNHSASWGKTMTVAVLKRGQKRYHVQCGHDQSNRYVAPSGYSQCRECRMEAALRFRGKIYPLERICPRCGTQFHPSKGTTLCKPCGETAKKESHRLVCNRFNQTTKGKANRHDTKARRRNILYRQLPGPSGLRRRRNDIYWRMLLVWRRSKRPRPC